MRSLPYKYLVAIAFVCGLFMDLLDMTVLNVALPTLGHRFGAGTSTLEWVVTGYLLSLAIWIPASGWIGDRFGTKKTFMFALAMFITGSALCGVAQSIGQLIAFRILQGVGGGMMTPVGTAMLFRAFPAEERAKASTVLAIPTAIAPAIGPVLGGWLVDYVSWRWIFYVNVPVGLFALLFSLVFLRENRQENAGGFDLGGFALSAAGLASILYGLSVAPLDGWLSAKALGAFGLGAITFATLIPLELRDREPMLDLRLFADRMFRSANLTLVSAWGALSGMFFVTVLFLQNLLGYSAIRTGLVTMATAIAVVLIAPVVGKLYPRVGPRRLLMFSLTVFAATSVCFALVGPRTSSWIIVAILALQGVGIGFTFIPAQAATFATITPQAMGRASSLYSTLRQVGNSLGVAVLATVLTERTLSHVNGAVSAVKASGDQALIHAASQHGALLGFHDVFFAAALLALLGVLTASFIRDEDAAATMQPAGERPLIEAHAA